MKFLLYASVDQQNIGQQLGTTDYSYFFLLRAFSAVLADIGEVVIVGDPVEAEAVHARSRAGDERCVLLSFAPPHKTPLGLACPTIPVFAWEYPDIPEYVQEQGWQEDIRYDWRYVFSVTGRAITLSEHTVSAVKRSMGNAYPVVAIPSPLAPAAAGNATRNIAAGSILALRASVADSLRMGLNADSLVTFEGDDATPLEPDDAQALPSPLPAAAWPGNTEETIEDALLLPGESYPPTCGWDIPPALPIRTRLHGVVYTTVLTPAAGRKNWEDLITAFCWAFKDRDDATLVLKLTGTDLTRHHRQLLMLLTKISPLRCRVIAIYGYLSDQEYAGLIDATTYYVNTSLCEGLCLPLVEFLNAGVPAIAPDNTAMADYIRDDLAFVVKSSPGLPTVWPHGDSQINRTSYHQLDWQSLLEAYMHSHTVARQQPERHAAMSRRARQAMQAYCGPAVVREQLLAFFQADLEPSAAFNDAHAQIDAAAVTP